MLKDQINILTFGDVHLGHHRTTSDFIINNVGHMLFIDNLLKDVDILNIEGDFWDRLLSLPNPYIDKIELFIIALLRACKKRNIIVRVLEGTPSHDWKQSDLFVRLNENSNIGCDLRHVTKLSIEYIGSLGINVLYVPDEWKPECDDVWSDVVKELDKKGLEKVDIAIMHGAFDYQLPSHINVSTHVPERYLGVVKYLIFIGHIHTFSIRDRIVATGSVDRISHGEEQPKGMTLATLYKDGTFNVEFIENKRAKKYITLKCMGMDLHSTMTAIESIVADIRGSGNISIKCDTGHPILGDIKPLTERYPNISFKVKVDRTPREKATLSTFSPVKVINITSENIGDLILDAVASNTDKELIKTLIDKELKECH